jgi:hypothetical protein
LFQKIVVVIPRDLKKDSIMPLRCSFFQNLSEFKRYQQRKKYLANDYSKEQAFTVILTLTIHDLHHTIGHVEYTCTVYLNTRLKAPAQGTS